MSEYFDKAREMGKALLGSPYSLRLSDAAAALREDPETQAKLEAYRAIQAEAEACPPTASPDDIARLRKRLADEQAALRRHPAIAGYIDAEAGYRQWVGQVVDIIKATAGVDSEENGCAGCAGCRKQG